MRKIQTLEGIARSLGAEGFKRYAKDYGNSRINIEASVVDAVHLLKSYRDDENLIDHFNNFRETIETEYTTSYTPFYKTEAFKQQNQNEINEFGYIVSM